MNPWSTALWGLGLVAALGSLYGLHRLALWLEARGHLYYLHKKPSGSAAGSFVALQRAIEPQSQHVLMVHEEVSRTDGESPGAGEPPGSGRDGAPSP
jgi:hypothetical protein